MPLKAADSIAKSEDLAQVQKLQLIRGDHGQTLSYGLSKPLLLICHIKIFDLFRCPVFSVPKDLKRFELTLDLQK